MFAQGADAIRWQWSAAYNKKYNSNWQKLTIIERKKEEMKKKFLAGLATGLLMMGMAGVASAYQIKWDPDDILMGGSNNKTSQEHTFNIVTGTPPFTVGVNTVTSAHLEIYTYDNNDNGNANEKYDFDLDLSFQGTKEVPNNSGPGAAPFDLLSIASYLQDGSLSVIVKVHDGSFYLDKEVLTYEFGPTSPGGSGNAAGQVPEPATMLLFGTGLIGLARLGRKKLSK